jgi:hypothetical protein
MEAFEIGQLISEQDQSNQDYLEFLKVPALSAGLYMLAAGAVDRQEPHTEDEIYYVISGRGSTLRTARFKRDHSSMCRRTLNIAFTRSPRI